MRGARPFLQLLDQAKQTEFLVLIKMDGQEIPNVKAHVQPNKILIEDGNLPLEEGDTLRRGLKNGLTEEYVVLDRGYHSDSSHLLAHYQSQVRKKTAITHPSPINNNYTVTGPNSRINIDSSDYSTNIINADDAALFPTMPLFLLT